MAGAWWRRAPATAPRACRVLWTWRTVAELALAGALCAYWQLAHAPWGLREQRLLRRFDAVGRSGARAAAAAAVTREVVLFASGNRAMGSFLRNWGASVERLGRGLSWWLVPLDQAGYDDLAGDASTQWPLLRDASGAGDFSAARGAVRCGGARSAVAGAAGHSHSKRGVFCRMRLPTTHSGLHYSVDHPPKPISQGRRLHAHGAVQVGRRGVAAARRA